MLNAKQTNYLHLHFIVFIWGFTAVLGKLISIDALSLVWYRMGLAVPFIFLFVLYKRHVLKVPKKTVVWLLLAGITIALHWVTFFKAIKVSNVSIALATMSAGAFFTAILEPIWYKRKVIWYEIAFGVMVITGLLIIFKVETQYVDGIVLALISTFLSAVFSLINGKLVQQEKASVISFYELSFGVLFLSIYMLFQGNFSVAFFELTPNDWLYIGILALICTAYAFIASVQVMKYISPYTVMLTINLEPVYGILLAFLIFGESEKMNALFYVGAGVILLTVIANGILKNRNTLKKEDSA